MTSSTAPAISLLVPIYNVEHYLEECLKSAQIQSLTNIEIICINDGSTDSSLEIINSFIERDPRFKLINKENSGYGASMNKGLRAASGEYIGILESDDFLDADALKELYQAAKAQDVEVVKANFYYYWSKPERRDCFSALLRKGMCGLSSPRELPEIFYLKPTIWSAIYKKSFLEANSIAFLETPGASYQDASFNFKIWASTSKVLYLHKAFLHYRQDNEASSVNSPGKVYCVVDEYAEMQRYLDEHPEKRDWLQGILIRIKYDSYIWNYDRLSDRYKLEFLQKASEELNDDLQSGRMDLSLFEPWKKADMKLLLKSPRGYDEYRRKYSKPGKLNGVKRYNYLGGPKLVLQLTWDTLMRAK